MSTSTTLKEKQYKTRSEIRLSYFNMRNPKATYPSQKVRIKENTVFTVIDPIKKTIRLFGTCAVLPPVGLDFRISQEDFNLCEKYPKVVKGSEPDDKKDLFLFLRNVINLIDDCIHISTLRSKIIELVDPLQRDTYFHKLDLVRDQLNVQIHTKNKYFNIKVGENEITCSKELVLFNTENLLGIVPFSKVENELLEQLKSFSHSFKLNTYISQLMHFDMTQNEGSVMRIIKHFLKKLKVWIQK